MSEVQEISAICHREQRNADMVGGPDELDFWQRLAPASGWLKMRAAHKPPF